MKRKATTLSAAETQAVEAFIVDTQFWLHQLMESEGVSRAALAEKLNCSRARVSQLFGDHPNVTLETLARIYFALGQQPKVTCDKVEKIAKVMSSRSQAAALVSDATERAHQWTIKSATPASHNDIREAMVQAIFGSAYHGLVARGIGRDAEHYGWERDNHDWIPVRGTRPVHGWEGSRLKSHSRVRGQA